MLNIKLIEVKNKYIIHFPLLLILIIFFSISIYFSLNSLFNVHSINLTTNLSYLDYYDVIYTNQTKLNEFGFTLFYWHYLNFILVGIVLLIAMLGAIYLTLNVSYNSKRQDIFTQLNRENSINYIT